MAGLNSRLFFCKGGNKVKFIAKAYLIQNGSVIRPGEEVDLTAEQGKSLGEKVEKVEVKKSPKKEAKGE
jgi:hypothetical protein